MKRFILALSGIAAMLGSCCGPKDGEYTFRLLTTNDVHGRYYDSLYVDSRTDNSLLNVSWYVDSLRNAEGKDNIILLDAGDCLQGDNAAYYFNYVDTGSAHLCGHIQDDRSLYRGFPQSQHHRLYDRPYGHKDGQIQYLHN